MDRNFTAVVLMIFLLESLSARRAWIEIVLYSVNRWTTRVALRKESVDRNLLRGALALFLAGRSPQGERG